MNVRIVTGTGGYVYEQHADGSIIIIQSPQRGNTRTEVPRGSRAYEAILAEIGPFPDAESESTPTTPTAEPSNADAVTIDNSTPQILGGAETEAEKKLAEFAEAISNIEVDVHGEQVSVRPPYHINRGFRKEDAEEKRGANPRVNQLIKRVFAGQQGRGATSGKATPSQMRNFLQEAVNEGFVEDMSAQGLRDFLDAYGISTDCSGLAVQALNFLIDGDFERTIDEEIKAGMTGTGKLARYQKVRKPSDLWAGDMMVKGGEHVRLIIDVDVERDRIYFTTLESTASTVSEHGDGIGQRRWRFPVADTFSDLELMTNHVFRSARSKDKTYIYTRHHKV
jgi:hypothetical protein